MRRFRGQVLQATDPAERSLRLHYDAHGRLIELASDNGARYGFEHDAGDRLKTETCSTTSSARAGALSKTTA